MYIILSQRKDIESSYSDNLYKTYHFPAKYKNQISTGDVFVYYQGDRFDRAHRVYFGTGTVGRTRLFHEDYLGHYPFVVPDSHVSVVRTMNEVSSEYMYAYISSDIMQQYLEENLAGSTNQKELYIGVLESMNVSLPPLAEQHRIVAKIEELFSKLDQIEKSLEA